MYFISMDFLRLEITAGLIEGYFVSILAVHHKHITTGVCSLVIIYK